MTLSCAKIQHHKDDTHFSQKQVLSQALIYLSGGKLPFLSRKGGKEKNGEEEIACQQCVILIKAHTKCILLDGHFLVVET